MGLSDFIVAHTEELAADYEAFARTVIPAAAELDGAVLRGHAAELLQAIVTDMGTPQSAAQQADKARGQASRLSPALTAAERHGAHRASHGYLVHQAVAEYRALRASVIDRWMRTRPQVGPEDVDALIRFNEAIDQALAEAVHHYALVAAHDRTVFLGVLSHELRNPLGTIVLSSEVMQRDAERQRASPGAIERTLRAARRIENILDDMLDFVRGETQGGVHVRPAAMDMDALCARVTQDLQAAFPQHTIQLSRCGDGAGVWDENRMAQALTNLVNNALKYGDPAQPVHVSVGADGDDRIVVAVHNQGPPIAEHRLDALFQPLVRGDLNKNPSSLGLGLYIVRQIALAHGGDVLVNSAPGSGTTFSLRLPRMPGDGSSTSAFGTLGMH